jgi:hypothetical protein
VSTFTLCFKLIPYFGCLYGGTYAILEVLFPALRDPDFNRWEIDDGSGSYIEVMGWKKVLTPPRVIAQGYMSNRAACTVAVFAGLIFLIIGTLGVRHVSGFPPFVPDVFDRF